MAAIAVPLLSAPPAGAAPGDPVVTLEQGIAGCNGVRPTPGSGNTNKRLVSGDLEPGGTVTFEISFPVDANDVGGDFAITDCVFIGGKAALKYTVAFVPNNENFLLTFDLVIPADAPIGALYCNFAKTTQSPSTSQASNRKAGPACFRIGGNLRIIKVAEGDPNHTPLVGASFDVVCTTGTETIPPVVISGLSGATAFSNGAYRASGTADTGVIAIAGPEGTPCTVTETAAPAGYDLPADPSFDFTIPGVTQQQEIDYIEDPLTQNTTSIVTSATSGTLGDSITDTATLSGATADAGGTITFNVFDNPGCDGPPVFTDTVDVSGNGDYTSAPFTPTSPGEFFWIASYSGDANNRPSAGSCRDENEISEIAAPSTHETSPTATHTARTDTFSPTSAPTSPTSPTHGVASTGAGPVHDQVSWAMALLILGGCAVWAGRRRYQRLH
jgi:hypothetical protein